MKLVISLVVVGIVVGFAPLPSRSVTRFSRLSMAFEFSPPSFDSFLKQFGGAATSPEQPVTVIEIVAPIPVAPAVVIQVISVPPPSELATALSGGEFAVGLGLGLLPYLLIPVIALSAIKGLIKAPKPLPVPIEPTTTVGAYTKSLREGLNEGIKELFSEQTADTELTKKGIKLSAAGFGTAIALTAVLFATSSAKEESKVVAKKPVAPAAIVKVVTPPTAAPVAPVTAPVTPAAVAAPAVIVAPSPVAPSVDSAIIDKTVADKAASEKAAAEKVASEKAAAEKAASEKAASEKVASEKAASEKAASEKAASEKAASEKAASEKAAAVKPAVTAPASVAPEYVPSVPKGMEPEKVDFAALKLLRVSTVSCSLATRLLRTPLNSTQDINNTIIIS